MGVIDDHPNIEFSIGMLWQYLQWGFITTLYSLKVVRAIENWALGRDEESGQRADI